MLCSTSLDECAIRQRIAVAALALIVPLLLVPSCDQPTNTTITNTVVDTTSHDFVWDQTTLGYDHTVLYDVFAVSDTDVWVVGDITELDVGMHRLLHHNAAHWTGRDWNIYDVKAAPARESTSHDSLLGPIYAVFGFSSDNVVFASCRQIQRWNGKGFENDNTPFDLFTGQVLKIWGSSDKDVWFVAGKGYQGNSFIAHYDGKSYTRYDPGFTDDINDIWGVGDTALCIASDWLFESTQTKILRLTKGKVEPVYTIGLPRDQKCIWFCPGMRALTITGDQDMQWDGTAWVRMSASAPLKYYRMAIRGTAPNDYFVVDQSTGVAHFNGSTWARWLFGNECDNYFMSMSCSRDNVWVVGTDNIGRGLIFHGRRQIPSRGYQGSF